MQVQDLVVFISGSRRGLSLALARAALAAGVKKADAAARDPSRTALPGVHQLKRDVTSDIDAAAAAAVCGDVNVLIDNAGIACGASAPSVGAMDGARAESETKGVAVPVGSMDTELTAAVQEPKANPDDVATQVLQAPVAGRDEVLADAAGRVAKAGLAAEPGIYVRTAA